MKPITIKTLESLRKGESYMYYRGNIDADAAWSTGKYQSLLHEIKATAARLVREKKIETMQRPSQKTYRIRNKCGKTSFDSVAVIEYIAIGI